MTVEDPGTTGQGGVAARSAALGERIAGLGLPLEAADPDAFGNPTFKVAREDLLTVGERLRSGLSLRYLACLTGLEWPDRFEVVYHLYDFETHGTVALKTACPLPPAPPKEGEAAAAETPDRPAEVPSVVGLWPAANWYEREAYDMYGIRFEGHPNLTRILMADDWEGYPLRKSYPMDVEGGY